MSNKPFVIVVGVDYSELSGLALERAFEIAGREPNAEVHAVLVLPPFNVDPTYVSATVVHDTAGAFERLQRYIEDKLRAFIRRHEGEPLTVPVRVVSYIRLDTISAGIAQLASDLEADLVVVGTHGRHGVSRLLMGSVAEGVVRWAPCPVLVMRPKAIAAPVPVIEPPCPRCVETREATAGAELWCAQHSERHGRRHTYHQGDRSGQETEFPLVTAAK
ncbi:MAG TPA: universal stress protein [Polyangiaceae bacterium]|jgi:nucleotide-binding universal stress UspA family protein